MRKEMMGTGKSEHTLPIVGIDPHRFQSQSALPAMFDYYKGYSDWVRSNSWSASILWDYGHAFNE